MQLKKEEVQTYVVETLREICSSSESVEIVPETDPIQHLGLDSFDGVAYACAIGSRIGVEIPPDVNPLVDDEQRRSRCVREIVELLMNILENKEAGVHAGEE